MAGINQPEKIGPLYDAEILIELFQIDHSDQIWVEWLHDDTPVEIEGKSPMKVEEFIEFLNKQKLNGDLVETCQNVPKDEDEIPASGMAWWAIVLIVLSVLAVLALGTLIYKR